MLIRIDPKSNVPLYEQIIQQIKELRAKGVLAPNDKLPSVRELSSLIVINPNTVSKAYKELERQGVIVTLRGKGTFVSEEEIGVASEKEREAVRKSIEQVIVNCVHLGITKEEIEHWINEFFQELGGEESNGN